MLLAVNISGLQKITSGEFLYIFGFLPIYNFTLISHHTITTFQLQFVLEIKQRRKRGHITILPRKWFSECRVFICRMGKVAVDQSSIKDKSWWLNIDLENGSFDELFTPTCCEYFLKVLYRWRNNESTVFCYPSRTYLLHGSEDTITHFRLKNGYSYLKTPVATASLYTIRCKL